MMNKRLPITTMLLGIVFVLFCQVFVQARRILQADLGRSSSYATNTTFTNQRRDLLTLTPSNVAIPTLDSHKVKNLPGLKTSVKINHYAGHLVVDEEKGGALFYWLIEAEEVDPATAPLLVWLNGGPGCSSMDGLFLELGPFRLDGDKLDQIKINPGSWHYAANLLFIDQPVGTGLSFTRSGDGYAGSDVQVNTHFYNFLLAFFKLHDRYTTVVNGKRKTRQFYISGESHAGHYIPCIAAHIMKKNIEAGVSTDASALHIDLQGIALGNPWTDPYNQYDVSEFAHGHGLITIGQRNRLKEKNRECRALLRDGKYNQKVCFDLLDDVVDSSSLSGSHKVLMYDARRFVHTTGVFPPGHEGVEKYLNRADVKAAIHATATPQPYVECADPPFLALSHQDGKGVTQELIEVLNSGVRMLLYSGQYDIICNHMGTERVLQELQWSGREEWIKAQPGVWLVDRQPAGYIKTYKNLQSLLVLNSGHMVPMDVPKIALDMISKFLNDKEFSAGNALVGVSLINPEEIRCENGGPTRSTKRGAGAMVGAIKKGVYSVLGYNMSTDNMSGRQQRQLQRGTHRLLRQPISSSSLSTSTSSSSSSLPNESRNPNNSSISWNGSTSSTMTYDNIPMTLESSSSLADDYGMCLESIPPSDMNVPNNPGNSGNSHVPLSTDNSADSICSVALMVTLGPLNTLAHPWSDMAVFDGYEKILRELLLQDIKTALLSLTSSLSATTSASTTPIVSSTTASSPIAPTSIASTTTSSTATPSSSAVPGTTTSPTTPIASSPLVEVSIAGLEPIYSEEEMGVTSNGIKHFLSHPLMYPLTHLIYTPSNTTSNTLVASTTIPSTPSHFVGVRIVAVRGHVNVRGRRQDTVHAVRSLVTQSTTHDTILRRGLLTSTLQQPVELVTTRRLPHQNHHDSSHKISSKYMHSMSSSSHVPPLDAPLFGSFTAWICAYGSEIFYVIYMIARYNWIFLCMMMILVSLGLIWLRQNVGGHKYMGHQHRSNLHGRL